MSLLKGNLKCIVINLILFYEELKNNFIVIYCKKIEIIVQKSGKLSMVYLENRKKIFRLIL